MDAAQALGVLGLTGPADAAEVKRSYRSLARTMHPDAGGDADAFVAIQAAYDLIQGGTDATVCAAPPQTRVAGVAARWWDTAGAWHEEPVAMDGVRLDLVPDRRAAQPASLDLVASILATGTPIGHLVLHSRAPGSRLHRIVSWLQPDLMAQLVARPATEGPRAGHDVDVELRATSGKARRIAADGPVPSGWTRRRGSESVRVVRAMRPARAPDATAVRIAREIDDLTRTLGWPLDQWFVLGEPPTERP